MEGEEGTYKRNSIPASCINAQVARLKDISLSIPVVVSMVEGVLAHGRGGLFSSLVVASTSFSAHSLGPVVIAKDGVLGREDSGSDRKEFGNGARSFLFCLYNCRKQKKQLLATAGACVGSSHLFLLLLKLVFCVAFNVNFTNKRTTTCLEKIPMDRWNIYTRSW